jgi:hypothetical protein
MVRGDCGGGQRGGMGAPLTWKAAAPCPPARTPVSQPAVYFIEFPDEFRAEKRVDRTTFVAVGPQVATRL